MVQPKGKETAVRHGRAKLGNVNSSDGHERVAVGYVRLPVRAGIAHTVTTSLRNAQGQVGASTASGSIPASPPLFFASSPSVCSV